MLKLSNMPKEMRTCVLRSNDVTGIFQFIRLFFYFSMIASSGLSKTLTEDTSTALTEATSKTRNPIYMLVSRAVCNLN